MPPESDAPNANSIGLALADVEWQDTHFAAMRPEYEAMLRWVGLQPGWKVLDAACGTGSYLPLMAELVGGSGEVHALDLDSPTVEVVAHRAKQLAWAAPVHPRVGDLLELPYPDGSFDASWCANTSQYLSDPQVRVMIRELKRVVRPGGLVAVKEYDATALQYQPCPPMLWLRFVEAWSRSGDAQGSADNRTIRLGEWLRAEGLTDIRQRPTLMVRCQPLRPAERRFCRDLLLYCADRASRLALPPEDKAAWEKLADVDAPDHILNHPDYQYRAIQTVFVGRVPPA